MESKHNGSDKSPDENKENSDDVKELLDKKDYFDETATVDENEDSDDEKKKDESSWILKLFSKNKDDDQSIDKTVSSTSSIKPNSSHHKKVRIKVRRKKRKATHMKPAIPKLTTSSTDLPQPQASTVKVSHEKITKRKKSSFNISLRRKSTAKLNKVASLTSLASLKGSDDDNRRSKKKKVNKLGRKDSSKTRDSFMEISKVQRNFEDDDSTTHESTNSGKHKKGVTKLKRKESLQDIPEEKVQEDEESLSDEESRQSLKRKRSHTTSRIRIGKKIRRRKRKEKTKSISFLTPEGNKIILDFSYADKKLSIASAFFDDDEGISVGIPEDPETVLYPRKVNNRRRKSKRKSKAHRKESRAQATDTDDLQLVSEPEEKEMTIEKPEDEKIHKVKYFYKYSSFNDRFCVIQNLESMSSSIYTEAGFPTLPDKEWIMDYSPSSEEDAEDYLRKKRKSLKSGVHPQDPLFDAFHPFWNSLRVFGRMPFTFVLDKETQMMSCKFITSGISFWIYSFTSFLLCLVFGLFAISLTSIKSIDANSNETTPHQQVERLLLDKHWLNALLFSCNLIVIIFNSFAIVFHGSVSAEYINVFHKYLTLLQYDVKHGIYYLSLLHCVLPVIDLAVVLRMNAFNILDFREATTFLTLCFTRFFHDGTAETLKASWMDYAIYAVVVLQVYVLFCTRNLIFLVTLYCRTLRDIAFEWSMRVGYLFKMIQHNDRLASIININKPHNEERRLFREHNAITDSVRKLSKSFGGVFLVYFIIQTFIITFELFRLARSIVGEQYNFTQEYVEDTNIAYNQPRSVKILGALYYTFGSLFSFLVVSSFASAVGENLLLGFEHVRRVGIIGATDCHTRRFILSLVIKYHPKHPCLVNARGFFKLDKSFVIATLGTAFGFFFVLTNLNFPLALKVPIDFPCDDDFSKLCVDTISVRDTASVIQVLKRNQETMANIVNELDITTTKVESFSTTPQMYTSSTTLDAYTKPDEILDNTSTELLEEITTQEITTIETTTKYVSTRRPRFSPYGHCEESELEMTFEDPSIKQPCTNTKYWKCFNGYSPYPSMHYFGCHNTEVVYCLPCQVCVLLDECKARSGLK